MASQHPLPNKPQPVWDVLVVGGGASGVAAAIVAKKRGCSVLVLEGADRILKKVRQAGNGKCNLLSSQSTQNQYNTPLVNQVFDRVPFATLCDFFLQNGIVLKEEKGRIFPHSEQGSTVVTALLESLAALGVEVLTNHAVTNIKKQGQRFVISTQTAVFCAKQVVFATGSKAGFGQESLHLLEPLLHTQTRRLPALVPLLTDTQFLRGLKGVRTKAKVSLAVGGKTLFFVQDEVLFKDNGVSGSAIFELSQHYARLGAPKNTALVFDFAPDFTQEVLTELLTKTTVFAFFHKELAANILRYAAAKTSGDVASAIKAFEVPVEALSSFDLAQVCVGGIRLDEVDFFTMQSKRTKGLYVVGEALDVDGACGGYNLMFAFASGILAGESVWV